MHTDRNIPHYRIWPAFAVGMPLTAGLVASTVWGDPWTLAPAWTVVGWVLVAAFCVWNGWALLLVVRHRTGLLPGQETTDLITSGPFAVSRNPLYVGLAVLHAGVALVASSVWALLLLPVSVAALEWGAIRPEERLMRETFGERYEAYERRVRRWL